MAEEKEKLGWKMNKIGMLLISMLFLSLAVVIKPVAGGATVVKVDPSLIEYHENAIGQQFTINVTIVDVTNLYGFDLKFTWNTTYLNYVSRSVLVPRDTYPDGVLWKPILNVTDEVNTTAGTYWIAKASMWPAQSFNGSGTVFTMTFQIISQPVQPQPDANITLQLYSTDLSNNAGAPIPHTSEDGIVKLYALPVAVTIPGDLNGDFKVSLADLVILAIAYGSRPGDTRWNTNADIDGNSVVGLSDLVILANHYGQHIP